MSAQRGPSAAADRASGRRAGRAGCRTGVEQHLSISRELGVFFTFNFFQLRFPPVTDSPAFFSLLAGLLLLRGPRVCLVSFCYTIPTSLEFTEASNTLLPQMASNDSTRSPTRTALQLQATALALRNQAQILEDAALALEKEDTTSQGVVPFRAASHRRATRAVPEPSLFADPMACVARIWGTCVACVSWSACGCAQPPSQQRVAVSNEVRCVTDC